MTLLPPPYSPGSQAEDPLPPLALTPGTLAATRAFFFMKQVLYNALFGMNPPLQCGFPCPVAKPAAWMLPHSQPLWYGWLLSPTCPWCNCVYHVSKLCCQDECLISLFRHHGCLQSVAKDIGRVAWCRGSIRHESWLWSWGLTNKQVIYPGLIFLI